MKIIVKVVYSKVLQFISEEVFINELPELKCKEIRLLWSQ